MRMISNLICIVYQLKHHCCIVAKGESFVKTLVNHRRHVSFIWSTSNPYLLPYSWWLFISSFVLVQTHSGFDWSHGNAERAIRDGAGWCGHHQSSHWSHPGERGLDRGRFVCPSCWHVRLKTVMASSVLRLLNVYFQFASNRGLVSHCISILKVPAGKTPQWVFSNCFPTI